QGAGVAAPDGDAVAAVAPGAPVAHDPVPLDADRRVLRGSAAQHDARAAGAGDGQAADRDEAGTLQPDRVTLRALPDRPVQHHAAGRQRRIRLDGDAARLDQRARILAGDAHLLDVVARPYLHRVARLRRVHRNLDAAVARGPPAA